MRATVVCASLLLLFGCTGDMGPQGQQGLQGIPGEMGNPGLDGPMAGIRNGSHRTVFQSTATPFHYLVVDRAGTVLGENANPDPVIAQALAESGDVYIHQGLYPLSSSFTGFTMRSHQRLRMDQDATLSVPTGYSGAAFIFPDGSRHSVVEGGRLREQGTVLRRWTAIILDAVNGGIAFNSVRDTQVTHAGVGIKLRFTGGTSSTAWINGNSFDSIVLEAPIVGICFEAGGIVGAHPTACASTAPFPKNWGPNRNVFQNILGQGASMTTHGVKDIGGRSNSFINTRMWDLHTNPSAVTSNTTAAAEDTIIIGGIMTNQNFDDAGLRTKILDDWQQVKAPSLSTPKVDLSRLADAGTVPAGYGRIYVKSVDANNDRLYIKLMRNGVMTEVPITP